MTYESCTISNQPEGMSMTTTNNDSPNRKVVCPLCQSSDNAHFLTCPSGDRDKGDKRTYEFVRCSRCSHVFASFSATDPKDIETYKEDYYHKSEETSTLNSWILRNKCKRWLRISKAKSILDVGCGDGVFIQLMSDMGVKAAGTDLSEFAGNKIVDKSIPVYRSIEEAKTGRPEGYDLIVINHVLEHMPDPRMVIDQCRDMLTPSGCLVLAVPDLSSYQTRLAGPMWYGYDPPRHLHCFSSTRLEQLLQESKFEVKGNWKPIMEFLLVFPKNTLEHWRGDQERRIPGWAMILLALPLNAAKLMGPFRGSVEMLARKV